MEWFRIIYSSPSAEELKSSTYFSVFLVYLDKLHSNWQLHGCLLVTVYVLRGLL